MEAKLAQSVPRGVSVFVKPLHYITVKKEITTPSPSDQFHYHPSEHCLFSLNTKLLVV
jgi:hypothetical protein